MGCTKSVEFLEEDDEDFESRLIIPPKMEMSVAVGMAPCRVFFIPSIQEEENGRKFIMVDTGFHTQLDSIKKFIETNKDGITYDNIEFIFVTHAHLDHAGNVNSLKKLAPKARVIINDLEAPFMNKGENAELILVGLMNKILMGIVDLFMEQSYEAYKIDKEHDIILQVSELKDKDFRIDDYGVRIMHLPGHTHGSCGIYLEDTKELIPGDLVVSDMSQKNLGSPPYCSSVEKMKESYHKIRDLRFKRLYSTHFTETVTFNRFEATFKKQFFSEKKEK